MAQRAFGGRGDNGAKAAVVAFAVLLSGCATAGTEIEPRLRAARTGGLPSSKRFDLTAPSRALFLNKRLKSGRVMQGFGFDPRNKRLFVAQLVDEPSADASGDLVINRLDFSGRRTGHMYLRGFGHGISIGVEPSGKNTYLWVEVDPVGASARGTRLARFKFVHGKTLTGDSPALAKYRPIPGIRSVTAAIDPVNRRLAMRYRKNGRRRVAVYKLADIKARRYHKRLVDVALPPQKGEVFQGYALYGRYLYTYYGTAYGPGNPKPGNARLSTIDLNTGKRIAGPTLTKAGASLPYREPEGMAVYRTASGQMRLFFGFASGDLGERRANLFYKNVLIK
ncbi:MULTISPECIES: teichoic acid biosynthesis protein C [Thermomonospora]|uniref:phage baseplate protein n=1 Tax=Thermomonospora TaxID=2019 RepID=UPI00019EDBCA|nr:MULTISPECIES: teichoic acid biosynthesis protein C [Thermomonospora]